MGWKVEESRCGRDAIDWGDVLFSLGVSVFYGRMTDHHKFSGRVT